MASSNGTSTRTAVATEQLPQLKTVRHEAVNALELRSYVRERRGRELAGRRTFLPTALNRRRSIHDGRGMIAVNVPANAEVFWNGTKSTLKGNTRFYSTIPLSANGAVQNFEARWIGQDGKAASRRLEVRALPNTTVNVDLCGPSPTAKLTCPPCSIRRPIELVATAARPTD